MDAPRSVATICRWALAFMWAWQGLVPKLLGPHTDELAMDMALGVGHDTAVLVARAAGMMEIGMAAVVLLVPRAWPLQLTLAAMVGFLGYAAWAIPASLLGAFNPVALNVCAAALALAALVAERPAALPVDRAR